MPKKQQQCKRSSCTTVFTPRTPWHKYCSDTCRSIVWKTSKLVHDMADQVINEVE